MEQRIISTLRDCPARLVPTGDPINIPGGTFVTLTQNLGGTYTVIMNGNMARVDGTDADALGLESETLEFAPPADGQVDMDQVHQALASVYDPEIPVNIVDLGLIYRCELHNDSEAVSYTHLTLPTIVRECRSRWSRWQ